MSWSSPCDFHLLFILSMFSFRPCPFAVRKVGRLRESLASALDGATATATTATTHQDGLPRKTRGGGGKGLNGLERYGRGG